MKLGPGDVETLTDILSSDVMLLYAVGGKGIEQLIASVNGEFTTALKNKYANYIPPALIWDTDDNQEWVHPLNPAFARLGTRNIDGKVLSPGDVIWAESYKGEKTPIWIDQLSSIDSDTHPGQKTTFDIRRNRKTLDSLKRVVSKADGITVASPYLALPFSPGAIRPPWRW